MQRLSIVILGLIELLFIIITFEQKEKGSFTVGIAITMLVLIPLMYIINN